MRTKDTQSAYNKRLAKVAGKCFLCMQYKNKVVKKYKDFTVIVNDFPYTVWDNQIVKKHYLLVPNKHKVRLGSFTSEMISEYISILNEYEDNGFSYYHRSHANESKTVKHFHTHLIGF